MIRRTLIVLAVLGVVGGFASAIRDLYRFADRFCGQAEAGGNCRAIAHYFASSDTLIFCGSLAVLAILLALPLLRSSGK